MMTPSASHGNALARSLEKEHLDGLSVQKFSTFLLDECLEFLEGVVFEHQCCICRHYEIVLECQWRVLAIADNRNADRLKVLLETSLSRCRQCIRSYYHHRSWIESRWSRLALNSSLILSIQQDDQSRIGNCFSSTFNSDRDEKFQAVMELCAYPRYLLKDESLQNCMVDFILSDRDWSLLPFPGVCVCALLDSSILRQWASKILSKQSFSNSSLDCRSNLIAIEELLIRSSWCDMSLTVSLDQIFSYYVNFPGTSSSAILDALLRNSSKDANYAITNAIALFKSEMIKDARLIPLLKENLCNSSILEAFISHHLLGELLRQIPTLSLDATFERDFVASVARNIPILRTSNSICNCIKLLAYYGGGDTSSIAIAMQHLVFLVNKNVIPPSTRLSRRTMVAIITSHRHEEGKCTMGRWLAMFVHQKLAALEDVFSVMEESIKLVDVYHWLSCDAALADVFTKDLVNSRNDYARITKLMALVLVSERRPDDQFALSTWYDVCRVMKNASSSHHRSLLTCFCQWTLFPMRKDGQLERNSLEDDSLVLKLVCVLLLFNVYSQRRDVWEIAMVMLTIACDAHKRCVDRLSRSQSGQLTEAELKAVSSLGRVVTSLEDANLLLKQVITHALSDLRNVAVGFKAVALLVSFFRSQRMKVDMVNKQLLKDYFGKCAYSSLAEYQLVMSAIDEYEVKMASMLARPRLPKATSDQSNKSTDQSQSTSHAIESRSIRQVANGSSRSVVASGVDNSRSLNGALDLPSSAKSVSRLNALRTNMAIEGAMSRPANRRAQHALQSCHNLSNVNRPVKMDVYGNQSSSSSFEDEGEEDDDDDDGGILGKYSGSLYDGQAKQSLNQNYHSKSTYSSFTHLDGSKSSSRGIIILDDAASTSSIKRTNASKPSLTDNNHLHPDRDRDLLIQRFHRAILGFQRKDVNKTDAGDAALKTFHIPCTFDSPKSYLSTFLPLILEECHAQMHRAVQEGNLRGVIGNGESMEEEEEETRPTVNELGFNADRQGTQLPLVVGTMTHVDDFLEVCLESPTASSDADSTNKSPIRSRRFFEHDLVTLMMDDQRQFARSMDVSSSQQQNEVIRMMAVVSACESMYNAKSSKMRYTLRLLMDQFQRDQLLQCFKPGTAITAVRFGSVVTSMREYLGVHELVKSSSLTRLILKPELIHQQLASRAHHSAMWERRLETFKLNESQMLAACEVLGGSSPMVLIQGPPGTGKTRTIEAIVHTLITQRPSSESISTNRVLVCAPSNAAIDEVTRRLAVRFGDMTSQSMPKIVRIGSADAVALDVRKYLVDELVDQMMDRKSEDFRKAVGSIKDMKQRFISDASIVTSTLSTSGHDSLLGSRFDVIIVDEACQAVESSCVIPLRFNCRRLVLVGDPQQLPPTIISTSLQSSFSQSLFLRIQRINPNAVLLLDTQYRMHPNISSFPSRQFYQGLLVDGPALAMQRRMPWHRSKDPIGQPYCFIDVSNGKETTKKTGGLKRSNASAQSMMNVAEAALAVSLIKVICHYAGDQEPMAARIAIITPYRAQRDAIRFELQKQFGLTVWKLDADRGRPPLVEVSTVDSFQGQERDVIIFSTVRTNAENIGFLRDLRRLNVSLTRARCSLLVLGCASSLQQHEVWKDLIEDAKERNLLIDASVVLTAAGKISRKKNDLRNLSVFANVPVKSQVSEQTAKPTAILTPMERKRRAIMQLDEASS